MTPKGSRDGSRGFSLIEVVIVVALIAFIYSVALPNLGLRSESEIASKLNTLAGDVRNAFDLSVLTGKTYRLVFMMANGDYWLEEADREQVFLGSDKVDRDPTETEEKDEDLAFETKMKDYEDMSGDVVMDQKGDREIKPVSPVVLAKNQLRRTKWSHVDTAEWGHRSLGPQLLIKDMQSEHHGHRQVLSEMGDQARGVIYFFPSAYVQKAVMHIYYKKDDFIPDETKEPYTMVTQPFEGIAEILPGMVEVDVHEDRK